jgi:hypothetical protein
MSDTVKIDPELVAERAAWDKKSRKATIGTFVFIGLFYAVVLGVMTWAVITYAVPGFSVLGSRANHDSQQIIDAKESVRHAQAIIFFTLIGTVALYWPLRLTARYFDFKLGYRPTGFKPREAKTIDVTIENVNEDVRYFHVSGLYRPDEDYTFKVERLTEKRLFRQPEYSYRISEKDNKIGLHYTMDSSCFKGMTDDEITKNLIQTISFQLEEKTDHFKELSYAI